MTGGLRFVVADSIGSALSKSKRDSYSPLEQFHIKTLGRLAHALV
jgi:hypothetical protein